MKKMRFPLLIVMGVGVIGIILGSFFDFQISKAIANPHSYLGITISAIGPTIGFAAVALMGGGFIAFGLKKDYHIVLRILFFVLAACCFGVSIFYPAGEYFGVNGFSWLGVPKAVGYAVVLLPEAAAVVGGYFLFRNVQNKNMWIVWCIIIGLLLLALAAIVPTIKDFMRRPRYRFLMNGHEDMFHKWFEPFKEYKQYIADNPTEPHDNFKSYPSGHSAETAILIVAATLFPLADKKLEKYQMPAFCIACGVTALVMFARILAAAHFLSDVSWGMTIVVTLTFIANEVVMRVKALKVEE